MTHEDDLATSVGARRGLAAYFWLFVLFLYAPIIVLVVFSFNDSTVPALPLEGFTLRWYKDFLANDELLTSLRASATVAAVSSIVTVCLGTLGSIALVRHKFRAQSVLSSVLLAPLVIPFIVFGVALLTLFNALGVSLSLSTVVIGHVVLSLPYTVLVLVPRLQQIDHRLEEAATDLGAHGIRVFRSITLPLLLPALISAFLISFTISFDEYAVASFVVGDQATFPIYLFSQLRFPARVPPVIAVAVCVMVLSLLFIIAVEIGRRVLERRVDARMAVHAPSQETLA